MPAARGCRRRQPQQRSLALVFLIERRARHRRVEHELVKIGVVRDGIIDHAVDVFRRVRFEPDDAGSQDADPMGLQVAHQLVRVDLAEFE